ncbi:glycoside hydrolase superfamily [Lipomyces oligophaga]|uniref:glycoside hydrolase superfamily n=1 Tax=Lipomyces oligophaga TaxID=45792 RepID=UPI0034CE5390
MRSSVLLSIFAAAGYASAIGQLGMSLGVKRNSDGECKTSDDYNTDFDTIASYTDTVRVYAASDCNTLENIIPALKEKNFKLVLGVWPTDDTHFSEEKTALSTYLPTIDASYIPTILVGSEALYRGDLTADELASDINAVRDLVHAIDGYDSVPIGTVDSWNVLVDGANVDAITASDVVYANAFSYWQGQTMANSSYSFFDDIMQALQSIQTAKGATDITFWVGETGWPTDGGSYESSTPSVSNAATYWQESVCAMRAWGVNTFVFEAFDESWKPATSGVEGVETHWGVFTDDSDSSPKYSLSCTYD